MLYDILFPSDLCGDVVRNIAVSRMYLTLVPSGVRNTGFLKSPLTVVICIIDILTY